MAVLTDDHIEILARMVRQTCFIHGTQLQFFTKNADWTSRRRNSLGYEDFRNTATAKLLDGEGAPKKHGELKSNVRVPTYWAEDEEEINRRLNEVILEGPRKPMIKLEMNYPEFHVMENFLSEHKKWLKNLKDFSSRFTPNVKKAIAGFERELKKAKESDRLELARSSGVPLESEFTDVVDINGHGIYALGVDEWSEEESKTDVVLDALEKELILAIHRDRIHKLIEMDIQLRVRKINRAYPLNAHTHNM